MTESIESLLKSIGEQLAQGAYRNYADGLRQGRIDHDSGELMERLNIANGLLATLTAARDEARRERDGAKSAIVTLTARVEELRVAVREIHDMCCESRVTQAQTITSICCEVLPPALATEPKETR
jgi:hypothetical protein